MTDDHDGESDRVTAADIADFLHHLAELRAGARGDDSAKRAAFLARKAELFTRIADQATRSRFDAYSKQVRQTATPRPSRPICNCRSNGWGQIRVELPAARSTQMGPDHRRRPGPVLIDTAT